ncbi:MAG: hypothetical protein NVS9B12_13180 [Vulcanimicrobiaceae bacterium]
MSKVTKSKALKPVESTTGTSIATIDQQLAAEVADIKQQIGQPSGRKLTVKPTGSIVTPEGVDLGNEVQIVVLDFVSKNQFYTSPYNPNAVSPPDCYAIGRVIADMAPEKDAPAIQSETCSKCSLNQFGSGNNGKSKACKNSRELAVLVLDPEDPEAHTRPDAPIYSLSLPPTAIRSFDGAVGTIARALGGPPVKAILTLGAENAGTYALITFSHPEANPDYAAHAARRVECQDLLFRKPDYSAATQPPPRRAPARQAPRAAAGGRR